MGRELRGVVVVVEIGLLLNQRSQIVNHQEVLTRNGTQEVEMVENRKEVCPDLEIGEGILQLLSNSSLVRVE